MGFASTIMLRLLPNTSLKVNLTNKLEYDLKRVLVFDWDVHHGDGTQSCFGNEPKVTFISTHRYDRATFYPASEEGDYKNTGEGPSQGRHVNIPLNYVDEKFRQYKFQPPGDN